MKKQATEAQLGQGADYKFQRHFIELPRDHTIEDALEPQYWGALVQQKRLGVHDIIRVRTHDGSVDTCLTVTSIVVGAAKVELWPRNENAAALSRPAGVKVCPMDHRGISRVRVEGGSGRYRLLGVNAQEVSVHASPEEAEGAMRAYLGHLDLRLPTEAETAAHADAQVAAEDARQAAVDAKKKPKAA